MNTLPFRFALLLSTSAICSTIAAPAIASAKQPPEADSSSIASTDVDQPESTGHTDHDGHTIIVSGRRIQSPSDPISAPAVLEGEALAREIKPQLGEMLSGLPGVTSSGFAPGVSRPVLRGFDGPRVQVLIDGIGSLDASSVSGDHAVSIDTLTVESVEVLHGPQVLLFGSDPSGGAVNIRDKRIPRQVPDKPIMFDGLAAYGSAADTLMGGTSVDVRLASRLVAHVDGSYSRVNDLNVGGYVLSRPLREQTLADAAALAESGNTDAAESLASQAMRRGSIPNSGSETWSFGGGVAFIDAGGDIGIAVQRLANDYGIPPRPAVEPEEAAISMRQTRVDLRAGINPGGFIKRVELRGAYGDYGHVELHEGEPETHFASEAIDVRVEAVQRPLDGWSGTSGIQYRSARLSVTGEEAILPDNSTERFAAFTLQRLQSGSFDLEGAIRYENVKVKTLPGNLERRFNQYSGSAGLGWHPAEGLTLSISYSHGERAPSAEELFVDGAHHANQTYEIGNPDFTKERSNGIEAGLRYHTDDLAFSVIAFGTNFDDFITSVPTGEVVEDFPVYQYIQAPARFRGVEAEGAITFARHGDAAFSAEAGVDYTRAKLVDLGSVPRIPPLRMRGALQYKAPLLTIRGEFEWNAEQERVTENEYPTESYTLVNLNATLRPFGEDNAVSFIIAADNIFDVVGRLATSDTRDFTPIAGRDIRLTARVSF